MSSNCVSPEISIRTGKCGKVPTPTGVRYTTAVYKVKGGDIKNKSKKPWGYAVAAPQTGRERVPVPSEVKDKNYDPLITSEEWFRQLWIKKKPDSKGGIEALLGKEALDGPGDCGCTGCAPPTLVSTIDDDGNSAECAEYRVLAAEFVAELRIDTADGLPSLHILYKELWLSKDPWDLKLCGDIVSRALYVSTIARLFCRMRHLKKLGHSVPPLEDLIRLVRL